MSEQYFLKSKRLGFRPWSKEDIDLGIELWGDPAVGKYIGGPFSNGTINKRIFTEKSILRSHNVQYWPLFLLETNEFIGVCGLQPYNPSEKIYELGIHIKPAYWRQGYATEAAKAVIGYAFGQLGATAIFAGHHPEQMFAKTALEKLGFKYSHDEYYRPTGIDHPSYILKR